MKEQDLISKNIMLIGFMGAGKSTVSHQLSDMLGWEEIEMDDLIAAREGKSIPEIFAVCGEEYFRELESQLIESFGERKRLIVSCGGGAVLRPENVRNMKQGGRIILLTAKPETIYERVKDSTERPILNGNMNVEYITELMEKRRPLYEAAADLIIQTDGKSAEQICEDIIRMMKESED